MSKVKLTYFDFSGGRAEPIRMALAMGGVDFEDVRISFQEFREQRDTFPLKAVPTMELDGVVYTQCNAMTRYAGRLGGLYPTDDWQAFLCDEILEAAEDVSNAISKTFFLEGEELAKARAKLVEGPLTTLLSFFSARLESSGTEYFVGNRLTVADLKIFETVRRLQSGILDHVPTDLVDTLAPNLVDFASRIAAHPKVSAYLAAQ